MASGTRQTVYRVRGIPLNHGRKATEDLLRKAVAAEASLELRISTLARSPFRPEQVSTVIFQEPPECLRTGSEWTFEVTEESTTSGTSDEPLVLTLDTHFKNFTPLNSFENEADHKIDIIAVSGLGGNAFGSFKERGGSYMWLKDSLPRDLPGARILLYGYDTSLVESSSFQHLEDLGLTFLKQLTLTRDDINQKQRIVPIIFIAHSLGGLVVEEAIIHMSAGDPAQYLMFKSIYAALFFGVPKQGMDISSLVPMVGDQPNRFFLESLGRESGILRKQQREFSKVFSSRNSKIICFFETKLSPTAIEINGKWSMSGPLAVLVDSSSAMHCRSWEDSPSHMQPLDRTHSELVKFSRHDGDYDIVLHILRSLKSESHDFIQKLMLKAEGRLALYTSQEKDCLRSLAFPSMDYRFHNIGQPLQKTCDWLFNHPKFSKWLQREDVDRNHGIVWIKGNPGTGKSTIMKWGFQAILSRNEPSQAVTIGHFFNARGVELEQNPLGLFRSLVHQLCRQSPALLAQLTSRFEEKAETVGKGWQWQLQELQEFFQSAILSSRSYPITVFIDALDECAETDARSVVASLEDISTSAMLVGAILNVCLSSRHYPNIRIPNCLEIFVEVENYNDILRYIKTRFNTTLTPELVSSLETKVVKKASGVFLWVILVIQMLNKAADDGEIPARMEEIIERVPEDLNNLFAELFKTIDAKEWPETERIIRWLLRAERPFLPNELRYALAFDTEDSCQSYSTLRASPNFIPDDAQLEKTLRTRTRGLVEVKYVHSEHDNEQIYDSGTNSISIAEKDPSITTATVQFIHQSVQDFLINNLNTKSLLDSRTRITMGEDHSLITRACIRCVSTEELRTIPALIAAHHEPPSQMGYASKLAQVMSEDYPFMDYAVNNLFVHAKQAEVSGYDQTYLTSYFHLPTDECFKSWICLYDLRNLDLSDSFNGPATSLIHIVAAHGITTCLRTLLEIGVDSKAVGGAFSDALQAASGGGHVEAVKILLDYGAADGIDNEENDSLEAATYFAACGSYEQVAELLLKHNFDVNAQTGEGRTSLHEASLNGNLTFVRMLIEKGADLTIKDGEGLTALHEASWYGNLKVAALMIERGASVEEIDDVIATPLHCAATQGHEPVAELLLNNGAKLESIDIDAQTPLHLAVMGSHEQTVALLLSKGSSPILQDTKNRTALHWAAAVGSSPIVALLTKRGDISVFVNCMDDQGMTALHIAAREGHKLIAQMLVEAGATIGLYKEARLTALHWAIIFGHSFLVEFLLQKEADLGISVVLEDARGRDALYHAVTNKEPAMVMALLERYGTTAQEQDSLNSALYEAAILGNTTIIQLLLDRGAPIDSLSFNGETVLHAAARRGRKPTVLFLLEKGANIEQKDIDGRTALFNASSTNSIDIVKMLLHRGAHTGAQTIYGKTSLHAAAEKGHVSIVQLLLESGAEIDKKTERGSTALYLASLENKMSIVEILSNRAANIEAKTSDERTPLHAAAMGGDVLIVQFLLQKGADVNQKDKYGSTPLHLASRKDKSDNVEALLLAGADINAVTSVRKRTALHYAALEGYINTVQKLLEHLLNLEARDYSSWTALHHAAWGGYEGIVELLLNGGADASSCNRSRCTSLHLAAGGGYVLTAALLLDHGVDIKATDNDGRTALHWAAETGSSDTCSLLLNHGADPGARDSDQKTPLDDAFRSGHDELLEIFLQSLGGLDSSIDLVLL